MPYKFRNPGPWGAGASEDLDPIDVDNNFWQAIQDIQAKSSQGVGIDNIVVSGSQFTVVLTDHTLLGPYQLPVMTLTFKGEWLPNYAYLGGSIVTHGGTTYFIPVNHVSEATFDPGANDGHGQNFYEVLLQYPMLTLPAGGPVGWVLAKASPADYVFQWQPPNQAPVVVVETTSDTTINPVLIDGGKYFRCASGSGTTVVLPLDVTVPFPTGTELKFRQDTVFGVVDITAVDGVVINTIEGFLPKTAKQGAVIEAIKVDTNSWDVYGYLEAHA